MAFIYSEGTKDYLAATPALIVTFKASGSITAGRCVCYEVTSNDSSVYMPAAGTESGSDVPAGVALNTVANAADVAVLVWGYAKSLPNGNTAVTANRFITHSGSGYWVMSGSINNTLLKRVAGKAISGSAAGGTILAFIDCTKTSG